MREAYYFRTEDTAFGDTDCYVTDIQSILKQQESKSGDEAHLQTKQNKQEDTGSKLGKNREQSQMLQAWILVHR